jgi:hypothetical protein
MYTYRYSTEATITISLRCPICLKLRPVEKALKTTHAPVEALCCPEHAKEYVNRILALERKALVLFGRKRLRPGRKEKVQQRGVMAKSAERYLQEVWYEEKQDVV